MHVWSWGAALILLQACSPPAPSTRTFVVGVDQGWNLLDPAYDGSTTAAYVNELLTPAPMRTRFDCGSRFEPRYVVDDEWNGDWTVLTARLADGLTWDDGTPLLAEHFVSTYRRGLAERSTAMMRAFLDDIVQVEALDDHVIQWTFSAPQDPNTIWNQLHYGATHPDGPSAEGLPRAYGPWSMVAQERDQHIVLQQRAKAHPQAIERLAFRHLPDEDTRVRALRAGEIQAAEVTSFHHLSALTQQNPELRPYGRGWKRNQFIAWNLDDPKFSDVRVRRALTMALDIPGIIEKLASLPGGIPVATPMRSTISPSHCKAAITEHPLLPHDPDAARRLLAEAGWTDSDGDGWLDRGGEPFQFTLMTTSDNMLRLNLSQVVEAAWRDIGIDVHVRPLEHGTMYSDVRKGNFEAALGSLTAAPDPDLHRVWGVAPDGTPSTLNFSRYRNPVVQELLAQQARASDRETAIALSRKAQALIYEDQPFTFLLWVQPVHLVHESVTDVASGFFAPYDQVETWTWREAAP